MAMENLYPPIVATYMPAFVKDKEDSVCRVYFSLSQYNTPEDLNKDLVQVTVTDQDTCISALRSDTYPSGVKLATLREDEEKLTDDKYYIEIYPNDLEDGFETNTYYKVQIRFTAIAAPIPTVDTEGENSGKIAIDDWLAGNLKSFSEWSTVCLIRGISAPKMTIVGFKNNAETTLWGSTEVDIVGTLSFADAEENDTLKSYSIKIYSQLGRLLTDSGIIYSESLYSNVNEMNYRFKYNFTDAESYILEVQWTTRNLYTQTDSHNFSILEETSGVLDATVTAEVDNENGRIGVHIEAKDKHQKFAGSFTIRRTSSDTNFTIWEDIRTLTLSEEGSLNITWWDMTVENGVWYKYCVQRRDSLGARGIAVIMKQPVMVVTDNMFLLAEDRQLKIKLNPNVSSLKYNVMETKTDTIGGRYPIIKRNGETYYRSFPITGMISHFMDKSDYSIWELDEGNDLFTSREELFGESLNRYDKYNEENSITQYDDYLYEREFREKVIEFLYKNNVKLFRSTQEGNVLVKLMDINLTPVDGLDRYLYTFTATAYEIDECNIDNYYNYKVQTLLGDYEKQIISYISYLGQMNITVPAGQDAVKIISDEYQKYSTPGYNLKINKLDYLRLEFEEKPYLIIESGSGPVPLSDVAMAKASRMRRMASQTIYDQAILGYIVRINNKDIVVNPEGIYELMGENVEITSISFPVPTKVSFSFNIRATQEENLKELIKIRTYYNKVGQLWGGFNYKDSLYTMIWDKYFESYSTYQQTLMAINGVVIEADPGTIVYVKEKGEEPQRHMIGDTCLLEFYNEDVPIEDIYFAGMELRPATAAESERLVLPEYKYVEVTETYASFDRLPTDLLKGRVYTIENAKYWYDGLHFYLAEITDDIAYVKKPVDAIVNYDCYVMKGEYNV